MMNTDRLFGSKGAMNWKTALKTATAAAQGQVVVSNNSAESSSSSSSADVYAVPVDQPQTHTKADF